MVGGAEQASHTEIRTFPLTVIRERCSQAIHILDRFHIVAKMNTALDQVRAGEARRLARDGYEPVLKKTRWCVLKRRANLIAELGRQVPR